MLNRVGSEHLRSGRDPAGRRRWAGAFAPFVRVTLIALGVALALGIGVAWLKGTSAGQLPAEYGGFD